ncbi:hypothetical protein Poli38472_005286 [Pythium oligandrum]|uniref:KH type-2 domain-containing protein n=1 Tax=Pythium oligandrum TaxID=41045 RepID=A0A8K1FLG9_PYTOL|nr:hypothetical protein Poli38472_005286 [Pythium oligandrum]|eukprot:TMW62668.1 hypothetical protein Poli38472_005286 [Pythium oligandrum]
MVVVAIWTRGVTPAWRLRAADAALFHTTRCVTAYSSGHGKGRGPFRGKDTKPKRVEREEPPVRDLEKEWRELRSKAFPIPRPRDPLDAKIKEALKERNRKRRLGLLPDEDDDDEAFTERYRKQLEKQQKHREWVAQQKGFQQNLHDRGDDYAQRRRAERRPTSQKEKTFTRLHSAPDSVLERAYLDPDEPKRPKALDIAVIGRPNAGKSSIVNNLVNATVSAVSPKYNTTRDRALGILTEKDTQLTFYDTPGLIKPKESHQYIRELVTTAAETVESVDVSMLVVDAVKRLDDDAMEALQKFVTTSAQVGSPIMLVMNKFDLVGDREEINLKHKIRDISQMIEEVYEGHYDSEESELKIDPLEYIGDSALKVSALRGIGMPQLKSTLMSLAVKRSWNYHSSFKSDQSDLDLVKEIIREKLFRRFNKELPYMIEQENVGWTRFKDHSIRIDQDIFVPAPRVRKMVIGRNGDTIRALGMDARQEIESLLGCPVHLYLNVRVR